MMLLLPNLSMLPMLLLLQKQSVLRMPPMLPTLPVSPKLPVPYTLLMVQLLSVLLSERGEGASHRASDS